LKGSPWVVFNYGLTYQAAVSAFHSSKIGLKIAIVATAVGAGGLKQATVQRLNAGPSHEGVIEDH
jgi:hypothetical protein